MQTRIVSLSTLLLLGYLIVSFAFFPTSIENKIEIKGQPVRVFDVVTTAKYWPQWHPATLAVSGAIDHPMQLGDTIYEQVNIFGIPGLVEWKVVELEQPSSVKLDGHSLLFAGATIRYQFESRGDSVRFTRTLDYAFLGLGGPLDSIWIKPIMTRQSAVAVRNLKAMVERQLSQ